MNARFPSATRFAASSILGIVLAAGIAPQAAAFVLTPPTVTNSAPPFSAGFPGSAAVDDNFGEYASASLGVDTFLEFTFPSAATFDRIVVVNRNSTGMSDLIGDFTLTFDGGPLTASVLRTPVRGQSAIHSLGGLFTATTVRLDVDSIGLGDAFNNTGAMEVLFVRTPLGQMAISGVSILGSAAPFNGDFAATGAIDGFVSRTGAAGNKFEYASAGLGVDAFVDFDLGATLPVGGFDFFDRIAAVDHVSDFNLIFSQNVTFGDGDDITQSYSKPGIGIGAEFAPINARYVRYDVTGLSSTGVNTGVSEVTFYAVPEPAAGALLAFGLLGFARRRRG